MADIPIYDDAGNIVGYRQSVGTTGTSTVNTSQPAYQFTRQNFQNDPLNFLGNALKDGWDWFTTTKGSGDNASAPVQWSLTGLGLLQQMRHDRQLEEVARKQLAFSKGNTQANFMNQGTNFINQGLWQVEALNAFNPGAAAERAQNLNSAINQMNNAGSRIELGGNTFADQQNALKKYSQLANNGPRMA